MNSIKNIIKKHWIKISLYLLIHIPLGLFIIATLGFTVYAHFPRDYSTVINFTYPSNSTKLTLSAHGVKDTSNSWSAPLTNFINNVSPAKQTSFAHSISWQAFSDNVLICSVLGRNLGQEIGEKLAQNKQLSKVHLIGHSCGAFVVYGICEGLKEQQSKIIVQTTFLDPVSVYSGFFWDYGVKNFGTCANFSDTYIDTHDKVPGSNELLPHSKTKDVTMLRLQLKSKTAPHIWPTEYYLKSYKNNEVPII